MVRPGIRPASITPPLSMGIYITNSTSQTLYFPVFLFCILDNNAYFCILEESFTKGRTVRVQEGLPERSWSVGNGPVWKMKE